MKLPLIAFQTVIIMMKTMAMTINIVNIIPRLIECKVVTLACDKNLKSVI